MLISIRKIFESIKYTTSQSKHTKTTQTSSVSMFHMILVSLELQIYQKKIL
jgi:hypothetical protein